MEFFNQIAPELKLPLVVAVGLVGFLAVLGASSYSVVPDKLDEKVPDSPAASSSSEETDKVDSPKVKTPKRTARSPKEALGTFTSPEGRRISRRLQNKQKDQ